MKKSLIVVAVAAALPAFAQAQTNVTLYGLIDAGIAHVNPGTGGKSNFRVDTGHVAGNRWGLRGTEDLGGGMAANFTLENGFMADTGAAGQGGLLFGRQAWAGLSFAKGMAEVRLGRQYSPTFWVLANYDTLGLGWWGNTAGFTGIANVRVDNSIEASVNASGFTGRLMLGTGAESTTAGQTKAGRFTGLGAGWANAQFGVMGAYHEFESNPVATQKNKEWSVGGSAAFGPAKILAGYYLADPAGASNNRKSLWGGVQYKIGAGTIMGQIAQTKIDGGAKATTVALAYEHALSKRTSLYANYGMVTNNATGTVGLASSSNAVAAGAAGSDPKALALGVKHTF